MSENTINAALHSMGYNAMARTIMDEVLGERVDLIEHQLAHQVKDVTIGGKLPEVPSLSFS